MAECRECGIEASPMLYSCNFCESKVCGDHRLPENHDCLPPQALKEAKEERSKEPIREPPGASHERCAECENAVAPGKDLCPECRYDPKRSSRSVETTTSKAAETSEGGVVDWTGVRYWLETSWLRTRSWTSLLVMVVVVFGGIGAGLFAFFTRESSYFGVEVPRIVLGGLEFQPPWVAGIGGLLLVLFSFGVGLRAT